MITQLLFTQMNQITQLISRTQLEQRLRALAIAHFLLAALAAVVTILVLISALAFSASMYGLTGGNLVDAFSYFRAIGAGTLLASFTMAVISAAAGWNLLTQRSRKFGLVLELAILFLFPFGTILGVVTLLVLVRAPVREQFGVPAPAVNVQ